VLVAPLLHLLFGGCGFLLVETGIAAKKYNLRGKSETGADFSTIPYDPQQEVFANPQ